MLNILEMDPPELYHSAIDESTRRCLQLKWEEFDIEKLWREELGILKTESHDM